MISSPSSSTFTPSRSIASKYLTENDSPQLSPKRSFAQLEEDHLSQPDLKRRDVHPSRRAPLDPLENRPLRNSQSTDSAPYHTLVTPSSLPDLPVSHSEQLVSSGSCGIQRSDIPTALVCSWPPPASSSSTARSSSRRRPVGQLSSQPHRLNEKSPSRVTFLESTTAWNPPGSFQTQRSAAMTKPTTTGWKSENVFQPIRSRPNSMPIVRRPPEELWRSDSGPLTEADRESVDAADLRKYPTPPGLFLPRPELRRSGSSLDLLPRGSVSLYLARGSQPLRASEHTKAVPPIGAERGRVVSITPFKSPTRNFPATPSHRAPNPAWQFSSPPPSPQPNQASGMNLSGATSPEKAQAASGDATSREDLGRLLRHAVRNKYAPKMISPLSPLRTASPALDLSTDPAYQARMPSQLNVPSPRYVQAPLRRARTVCEGYQSLDLNATCVHCQECKRDTIGKRLLASRHRQRQARHLQRNGLLACPSRGSTNDDRVALACRVREVFAYEIDEEEKRLWDEVSAVTGAAPVLFSRAGASCVTASHRSDDGVHDDHLEMSDDGLLANESATLFRQVSVY